MGTWAFLVAPYIQCFLELMTPLLTAQMGLSATLVNLSSQAGVGLWKRGCKITGSHFLHSSMEASFGGGLEVTAVWFIGLWFVCDDSLSAL